jgi:uncharacterized phage protein gp47/JayE
MPITTKDFPSLVSQQVAAIQAGTSTLIDLTVGSVLRAIVEANAAVILWLQGLILQLLATTRAATSSGADLDSFVADFGLARLAAIAATGKVTFSRFTATMQATIPIGTTVQTADGTQAYTVVADVSNSAYNATLGVYVIPAGTSSAQVTVLAATAGTGANAAAGQINTLASAVPYVDTVTNAAAFTTGANAETDDALRRRFVGYIASLSKATKNAIGTGITGVQPGMHYTLVENQTYAGATQLGFFFAVVDDGTGVPPSSLITQVSTAIDAVRPLTSTFAVYAPVVVTANIAMTVSVAAGYDGTATKATVQAALLALVNGLQLGQTLPYTRLVQAAYDASPGVTNVTAITLNGGTADLTANTYSVIKTGTITIN